MTAFQKLRASMMFSTRQVALCASISVLAACSFTPGAGPSSRAVGRASHHAVSDADIKIVDLTDAVARRVVDSGGMTQFSEILGDGYPVGALIGKGDLLDVTIWEAPPAALFGSSMDLRGVSSSSIARGTSLPEQMVDSEGRINVPFVGGIEAAGRTPQQVARDIVGRLAGKAHQPQAIVRVVRNATTNITIVGDVAGSGRVPLTARGERLLDVLAAVGGVKQPVGKTTIQITRGDRIVSMPLETVIRDPRQNIRLQPDDVVTALFQPFSFTALGATGTNAEVNFEGTGITLSQALGRVAGLQDFRADVKGVFIFRLEEPGALAPTLRSTKTTPDGKVPVIYRVNMTDPATLFVAQSFPIRNKDTLYVSNAPLADIQKFVNVISSTILPVATVSTIVP